jgi:chromosome segregation ATPase
VSDESREIGREVIASIAAFERDPATEEWGRALVDRTVAANQQSTSARLSETQAALAASQQDLTAMQAERDEAKALSEKLAGQLIDSIERICSASAELAAARTERDALTMLNAELKAENRRLTAELGSALRRLNEQRDWQVADRDTGLTCSACTGPIVRGQAFQPLADAKGFFSHVACPIAPGGEQ